MVRYLETFYRHRLLLLAPVILAVAASLSFVLTQPKTYEASAQIWFDTPPGQVAASQQTAAETGSAQLSELLSTRSFTQEVGAASSLDADLSASMQRGSGLIGKVTHLLPIFGDSASSNPQALNDKVFDTLTRYTAVKAGGPQIVSIAFDYPNSVVAASTTQAIVDQFSSELLANERRKAQSAIDLYNQEIAA